MVDSNPVTPLNCLAVGVVGADGGSHTGGVLDGSGDAESGVDGVGSSGGSLQNLTKNIEVIFKVNFEVIFVFFLRSWGSRGRRRG